MIDIFCEMNSQSLPLTNIQIKSTQSATTYKYNQTNDSHIYNDMQRKSRGLMRQVQGSNVPRNTMLDPLPAGPLPDL